MKDSKCPDAPDITVDPREIDAEMIRGLYQRVQPLVVANFGALILLTATLWSKVETPWLIAWATTLAAWTMLRFVLARIYMREVRDLAETWHWTLAFAVGAMVAGVLWGSSVILVEELAADSSKLVTAFLLAALSAAAIAGYTNSLLAFGGFVVPALLPHGVWLAVLDDTPSLVIAAFLVFWGLLLWVMARHLNEGFRASIALSLRNRNLAERLRGERDRAEAASRAKTRFLGHMSHELRTPLNAIIGYSEMIGQRMLGPIGNEKYAVYANDIHASGHHLLSIVEGILDVTGLEAGDIDIAEQPVDLAVTLQEACDAVATDADTKDLTLERTIASDLPRLFGDPARLAGVAHTLVENAVKFTPAGGAVAIAAWRTTEGGVAVEVHDSGYGMTPEEAKAAVVPFALLEAEDHLYRADKKPESSAATSPRINLPLANLVVERHGGTLAIDTAPGEGTRIQVFFPPDRLVEQAASKASDS